MRLLILVIFMVTLWVAALPVHAQLGDVVMAPGDVRLLLLRDDGSQLLIRFTPNADDTAWFLIHTAPSPEVKLQAELLNLRGEAVEGLEQSGEGGVVSLKAAIPESGDHFLRLTAAPDSAAGYLRVEYSLSEPNAERPTDALTFLKDPIEVTFDEPFADNSRRWWVGSTENTFTEVADDALVMTLSGAGRTLSGFTAVQGTEQPRYTVEAQVEIAPQVGDGTFGLIVRLLDPVNFYLFQIAPKVGAWRFALMSEGQWSTLFGWNRDERLLNAEGTHSLQVWVLGDVFLLGWDGQPLGHLRDSTLASGGVGFYAELPPGGVGASVIAWERLKVGVQPQEFRWGEPALPDAAQLTAGGAVIFVGGEAQSLEDLLIGNWFWNDQQDSMTMIFAADGNFTQRLAPMTKEGETVEQTGRWFVDEGSILVIQLEGLPEQRYRPVLDSTNTLLTIPELGGRSFVRLPPETSE